MKKIKRCSNMNWTNTNDLDTKEVESITSEILTSLSFFRKGCTLSKPAININTPKTLSEEGITNSISNPVYEGSCNSFDSVGIFNSINLFLLKLNENTIDTNFRLLKPLTLLFHNPLYANRVSFSQGVELSLNPLEKRSRKTKKVRKEKWR